MGEEHSAVTTYRRKNSDGTYFYTGFLWDIWQQMDLKLKNKYNFQLFFSSPENSNYDSFAKDVHDGKYDIVIGSFNQSNKREDLIDYTSPFLIDANSILYLKKINLVHDIKAVIFSSAGKLILYLLIIGIIFGYLIYVIDPKRFLNLKKNILISKQQFLLRSILTGISSMVGQTGYLSENASLEIKGIILVVLVLIISFVFILFLQASITKILITKKNEFFTQDNIKNYKLIGLEGWDTVTKMKRYGADVKIFKGKTTDELVKIYLNNQDKYDGFVIPYCEAYRYTISNPNLTLALNFGYEPQSFIVSENKKELVEDVNKVLNDLRFSLKLRIICRSYFGNITNVSACRL